MTAGNRQLVPLGIGTRALLVPEGWVAIEVARPDDDEPGDRPPHRAEGAMAAGVMQMQENPIASFATNVLLYRSAEGLTIPPGELGPGVVWHDSGSEGPVRRVTVRFGQFLLGAILTIHVWAVIETEPVLLVAVIDARTANQTFPVVQDVIRSPFDSDSIPWEKWFS